VIIGFLPREADGPINANTKQFIMNQWGRRMVLWPTQFKSLSHRRRTDMYVSTLRNYIRAMGGELKITVVFPNGVVEISQFQDVEERKKS